MKRVFVSEPVAIELLERFTGVYVPDGSVLALPHELGAIWSGCGGSKGANAAFKLGVRLDLVRGELRGCFLNGRSLRGGACTMDKRNRKPRTPQLLLTPSLAALS